MRRRSDLSVPLIVFGTLGVGFVMLVAQIVVGIGFAAMGWIDGITDSTLGDGDFLGVATTAGAVVGFPLLWALASAQSRLSTTDYLGLRNVGVRRVLEAVLVVAVLDIVFEFTWRAIDRDVISADMVEAYRSTDWIPAIWIGVALAAPVIEEIVFRGLLFAGFRRTALGFWGTALLTSGVWASMHIQYELPEIATIFVTGLVFAGIRERTGSAVPCIVAHVVSNAFAVGQTAHYVRGG